MHQPTLANGDPTSANTDVQSRSRRPLPGVRVRDPRAARLLLLLLLLLDGVPRALGACARAHCDGGGGGGRRAAAACLQSGGPQRGRTLPPVSRARNCCLLLHSLPHVCQCGEVLKPALLSHCPATTTPRIACSFPKSLRTKKKRLTTTNGS
ncbi:hypothetical protein HPB50_022726 [Hyalomma asiaticum]|uniref:Uncharacterized protein n=1 Tax=Hyalomma asiaticum TaxID=266040 RepID=A0ACB7SDG3_HYAAI|nr:hypothetical protein HPB50_022726 [Hyalomma asiaticum]